MRKLATLMLLLFAGSLMFAQTKQVKGNVSDAVDNTPLLGVSVVIKGTSEGVSTDFDGNYTINASADATLTFSYVGMENQEVKVGSRTTINVVMAPDTQSLKDVVIIGYGTQETGKVSGSYAKVSEESIAALNPVRAEDAIQGQASGVNVISSGSPGSKPTVLVRGIPSYTGTDPLVIIDGIQLTLDDLNALNANDIASINILKDAALSAIYGVKGGNGVIVIKTKSGKKNSKTVFNLNTYTGVQIVPNRVQVLNATEYAAILNEASSVTGEGLIFDDVAKLGYGTNWQDEVLKSALIREINLSVSGGSEKSTYYASLGILSQEGVVGGGDKSFFNRGNLATNFSSDLTDNLKLVFNNTLTSIESKTLAENSIGSILSNALNFDPTVSPYDADGNLGISETITQEIKNPLAQINDTYNNSTTNKLTGKIELQYKLSDNLKLTSRVGYSYVDIESKDFFPFVYYGKGHNQTNSHEDLSPLITVDSDTGEETSTQNRVSERRTNYFNYNAELFANYDFKIKEVNSFQTVLGVTMAKSKGSNITANAQGIPFNSWDYADVSSATGDIESQSSSSWQNIKRNLSFFGRVNYDYEGKYLVNFTGRVDGSTSFSEANKFAFFPSASVGWVISKEDFFKSDFINHFKVRTSLGSVGNDNITPQFFTISTFPKYTFGDAINSGSYLHTIPNEEIKWETQTQINAGFDITFYKNKFNITFDYYSKNVDDLLFNPTLSLYLGTPVYPSANIGSTESKGIELSLGYSEVINDDFKFNTQVNLTTSRNKVTAINNGDKFIWGSGYGIPWKDLTRFEEGFTPFYFYGYKTDGIFQNQSEVEAHATQSKAQAGDIRYVDVNGDGIIDPKDRTEIGNPYPKFTLGWNIAMNYKKIDLSVFTYASVGNDIYRAYERNLNYTNRHASVLNRWTGEGTSNSEPRVTFVDTNNNTRASDRYIEDGSYLRIKNIQLGYTIPLKSNSLRVYGQVKNALTLTKYTGFDPEISSGVADTGIDRGTYPQPRVWQLGLNFKF